MSYKKILANLKALPEGERFLAANVYFYTNSDGKRECGCVLGKGLPNLFEGRDPNNYHDSTTAWHSRSKLNEINIEALSRLVGEHKLEGMTPTEALALQRANDRYAFDMRSNENTLITRHARYIYIVNWLETMGKQNA